jgi:GT2 family glycosyltransferase
LEELNTVAVIVTFNRKAMLIECLRGLIGHSDNLKRVLIVDNASTDGTLGSLVEQGFLQVEGPIEQRVAAEGVVETGGVELAFSYRRLSQNTGGAGGFAEGFDWARSVDTDWVWVMDDDVVPVPGALDGLLAYRDKSECIHGIRLNEDGTKVGWGAAYDPQQIEVSARSRTLFPKDSAPFDVTAACFEGMLVSKRVLQQVPLPDPRFFIAWDDTYYGYLASRVTKVLYTSVPVLTRLRPTEEVEVVGPSRGVIAPMTLFYMHRNRFLIAHTEGNYSFRFIVATLWYLLKGLGKELLLLRRMVGARAVLAGTIAGARFCFGGQLRYWAQAHEAAMLSLAERESK